MDILTEVDAQLDFIGLRYDEHSKTLSYRLYSLFWFVATSCIIVPECIHFHVYFKDIDVASDALIFISATGTTIVKLIVFHRNKKRIASLIRTLRNNANKKCNGHQGNIYREYDGNCQRVCVIYYHILTMAIVFGMGLPLLVVAFNYLRGTLTPDVWYIPMPGSYFYDVSTSPGFELTYLWQTVTLIGIVRGFGAVDSLFVALCIHLRAGYRDLYGMIIDIDRSDSPGNLSIDIDELNKTGSEHLHLKQKQKKCIQFFMRIDSWFKDMERINSSIIFAQFTSTILIMCTSVFQMTSTLENGKALSYVNFVITYMSQLWIYAYFGHTLNNERLKLAEAVYSSSWYARPSNCRLFYKLSMMLAQSSIFVRGLGYLECSLITFAGVIKSSGTAFTLLRSVRDKF